MRFGFGVVCVENRPLRHVLSLHTLKKVAGTPSTSGVAVAIYTIKKKCCRPIPVFVFFLIRD